MLASVFDLRRNTYPDDLNFGFHSNFDFGSDFDISFSFLILASRLTWIVMYFYGAMTHYSTWIFNQTQVISVAQTQGPDWHAFLASFASLFTLLANLPDDWRRPGNEHLIDDTGQQQVIPTEAPLELVVQIYVARHRAINPLQDLGMTMLSWSFSKLKKGSRPEPI